MIRARVVTLKLMSEEIKILVLEIKIAHLNFSGCLYCSFCRQCKDRFGHNVFLFMKQLFGNSGLLESVELLLEDLLVAIDNLGSLLLVDDETFVNLKNKHKFELI